VTGDRYFAFLRAINTGKRRLTNEQLLAPFVELGFTEVAAYQAAGNVTFRCADDDDAAEARIEAALADAYGFDTPTFIRTAAEVGAIVAAQPFAADELAASTGKLQVTFLRAAPSLAAVDQAMALVPPEDRVVMSGRHWYWLPVAGVSDSQLPVEAVEAVLGEMTMRTLGTLQRISTKFAG
jgi:uncharacterized protein (DUF1697 family)